MQIEKRMDGWLLQITVRQQSAIRPSVQSQPIHWKSVVVASRADKQATHAWCTMASSLPPPIC